MFIQMKGILKNNRGCLLLFIVLVICNMLIGCNGINSTFHFISATAGENGLIEPEGAIMISEGGSQTFIITPDEGYQIANVLVDGISVGSGSTYTFENIWQNHTIYAGFIAPGSRVTNTTTGIGYDTIQAAIDAAEDGQNIVACPWIYLENLVFNNKHITLQSTDPLDPSIVADTIIDGGESVAVSVVRFIYGDTSTLYGFTIRNGWNFYGGGIAVNESAPIITSNKITGNGGQYGAGIFVFKGSPTIAGNTITGNRASSEFQSSKGGGIYLYESFPTITGNTITDNTAGWNGGGIYVSLNSGLLPATDRPSGWGTDRENIPVGVPLNPVEDIPVGVPLVPAEGEIFTIAGNEFLGNKHGTPLDYTEAAHVYFQ